MYTAKESFTWKYQQRKLIGDTENDKKTPPKPQECPHCNDCKGNTDPSRLRLHVFHHYKDRWEHRLDALEKGQNYFYCNMCPKRKQLRGANEEGARMSTICHFAIQHQELRDVLAKDKRLPENFDFRFGSDRYTLNVSITKRLLNVLKCVNKLNKKLKIFGLGYSRRFEWKTVSS